MSYINKEDMIEYLMEFDRTFGGPLSHLFEQEKVSKYKGMTIYELKNLCFLTDYFICFGSFLIRKIHLGARELKLVIKQTLFEQILHEKNF